MKLFKCTNNNSYQKKYHKKLHLIMAVAFLSLLLSFHSDNTMTVYAKDIEIEFEIDNDGSSAGYTGSSNSIVYDDSTMSLNDFPAIQEGDLWMIPVNEFLVGKMFCTYTYNENDNSFLIKDEYNNHTIKYVIGSNIITCDNKKVTMDSPVMKGTNKITGKSDYYVPAAVTIKKLGYAFSATDNKINIRTLVTYNLYTDETSFDENIYSNLITNVTLSANENNSKDTFKVTTLNKVLKDNITVKYNPKEYSVETIYKKTRNTFEDVLQEVNDSSIKKIKIWESNDYSTHIKLWYNPCYEYTDSILSFGTSFTTKKADFSIKAFLPDNIKFDKISTVDRYWDNEFIINIPGNHKKYYTSYKPVINNSEIKSITAAVSGSFTKLTVKTKSLCGYKLISDKDFFTVKVGNPKSIYSKIVLLDAGHGGKDSGACYKGLKEKNLNLEIIYTRLEKYLNSSDIKAYWTRHDDTFINLYTRPELSKKYEADLFISLHMNSASKSANGTEIYYSNKNNKVTSTGLSSKKAASIMINTITDSLNSKNRGVKQAGFVVTKYNSVPSILIELGFITGSSDYKKLKKTSYREKSAKAIYNGINNIFAEYPTGR